MSIIKDVLDPTVDKIVKQENPVTKSEKVAAVVDIATPVATGDDILKYYNRYGIV